MGHFRVELDNAVFRKGSSDLELLSIKFAAKSPENCGVETTFKMEVDRTWRIHFFSQTINEYGEFLPFPLPPSDETSRSLS